MCAGPQIYYRDTIGMGCPLQFDHHETVHLPHPYSCRKYLTCLSKSVIEQSCPGELHWNMFKKICDYPDQSGCVEVYTDIIGQSHTRYARRNRDRAY